MGLSTDWGFWWTSGGDGCLVHGFGRFGGQACVLDGLVHGFGILVDKWVEGWLRDG